MEEQQTQPSQPQAEGTKQGDQKNIGMAVVAYILFFIPLLTDAKKDPFVKFHVKQGLVLFIGWVVVWILNRALVYYLFWSLYWILNLVWLLDLGLLILTIVGIVNALNEKQEPLPLLGKLGASFKF